MLAVFGMPGGAEWAIIVGIIVLLFVPGAGFLGLGYLLGRNRAEKESGSVPPEPPPPVAIEPPSASQEKPAASDGTGQPDETAS